VEIWADGGMKSALDVVKMMLLGANRAGFGSLSMIAIGCTACRGCHLDTCHVGIATQIESAAEAEAKGLKRFVPREYDRAVDNLVTFYSELGQAIRIISAKLGFKRAQDMVGRSDLLLQVRGLDLVNLADMLRPMEMPEEMAAAVTEERMPVLVAAGAEIQSAFEVPAVISAPYHQSYARIDNAQRVLGSRFSGSRVQDHLDGSYRQLPPVKLSFTDGSIPGNGLAAYNADGVNIRVQGGAQDGVGKTSFGGRISILKAPNKYNRYINGSVGKSFAYGAQKGLFLIQGNADSRFCIRLSGADVVLGGEVTEPIRDDRGSIGARANIKGFAFEYMTNGRAVVLGDPGPWICSGMSGGVVYLRVQPEMGLTQEALQRRLAKGARVKLMPLHEKGKKDIAELLGAYCEELEATEQHAKAEQIRNLIAEPDKHFIRVVPDALQSDPNISTE
jgi:glutamate synthase (NADPH/NADH) large chain